MAVVRNAARPGTSIYPQQTWPHVAWELVEQLRFDDLPMRADENPTYIRSKRIFLLRKPQYTQSASLSLLLGYKLMNVDQGEVILDVGGFDGLAIDDEAKVLGVKPHGVVEGEEGVVHQGEKVPAEELS